MKHKPRKTDNNSVLALRQVKENVILIADDGFTCIPDHAERRVFRDKGPMTEIIFDPSHRRKGEPCGDFTTVVSPMQSRARLYVRCKAGRHYLDGQLCEAGEHGVKFDHYIGFWLKGTQPPKEKKHGA